MTVTLRYFGSLVDITQKKEELFSVDENNVSVSFLKNKIETAYEELKSTNYSIAVNQKLSNLDNKINDQDVIAFLPPFAGG
ncbi:MoaD/ThiS family protein [Flavobacterium sp.]|uniref:MoaD/ThiS family protein n=1 Tax=Flavobacterium sp. TaxID=239 RepID=UPI002BCAA534|nr:MoaD/ThiS family protein [Flavobacterium sp.]HSD08683.1 MoaD/ThiS family protein [Flavobacterium sp.]